MSEQRKSIHDGWTPQPHEQPQPGDPLAADSSTPEPGIAHAPWCRATAGWDDAGSGPSCNCGVATPEPGIDVERLAWAEHLVTEHGAYGTPDALPCYHQRGSVGDEQRIRDIIAEYARLAPPAKKE